jgi:hypothetical protein
MQLCYALTFNDGQMEAVKSALTHYLDVCRREIKNGANAPFIYHRETIPSLRARLTKQANAPTHIDDGEMTTLQDALSSYLEAREKRIAKGAAAPFVADRSMIRDIFECLDDAFERALIDRTAWESAHKSADY